MTNIRQITLIGLYTIIITSFACGQTSEKRVFSINQDNWEILDEPDYSIQYPDSFDLDKSGQMGMSFIMLSKKSSKQDSFRENVNLLIQNIAGQGIDLNMYVDITERQVKTLLTDGNIVESKRLSGNNRNFHKIIYTGKQGQFNLKWQQFYWIENEKAFILTLTCEEDQFDKYIKVGEAMMNTFIIK